MTCRSYSQVNMAHTNNGGTMKDKSAPQSRIRSAGELGQELLPAFSYQNATISETELLARHSAMRILQEEIESAIEWLRSEQLIETADEAGRVRLTPQGRSRWRDAMGHA